MAKKAIVTLVVGEAYIERWNKLCSENWRAYCRKHAYDLILLDQPLDNSSRAKNRSPAWQKCLVLEQPQVRQYERIVWLDSDILFNPKDAPDFCDGVPEEGVGAVDSFADPSPEENKLALQRFWDVNHSSPINVPGEYNTPEDIYRSFGPPVEVLPRMLNAGVLVVSPKRHNAIFRHVYDAYDDRGNPSYYENVPLSYELVKRGLVHWMDPKFNHLYTWSKLLHYPFMYDWRPRTFKDKILRRLAKWKGNDYEHRVAVACATASLLNCHCLHFAGCAKDMELVDLNAAKEGRVANLGVR